MVCNDVLLQVAEICSTKSRKLLIKEGKGLIGTLVTLCNEKNIDIQADAAAILCLLGRGDTYTKNLVLASDGAVRVIVHTAQAGRPEASTRALESLLG